mgnify:CR=1 FL=1
MKLINIKHRSEQVSFREAVLQGLGSGQGLFFPESFEALDDVAGLLQEPFVKRSVAVLGHLVGDEIDEATLEEMGGAQMHCEVSGCGDALVSSDEEAIAWAQQYFSYVADHTRVLPPAYAPEPPEDGYRPAEVLPEDPKAVYDMTSFLKGIVDEGTLFQIKERYAREVITAFGLLDGKPVGIVASQPNHLGGVLFVDSADKAARFMWLCDAMNLPLLYFADVPGFMIGTEVERQGIIRAGAKMLTAIAEATVPRISVIVRKAYGAGLYAFSGPGFRPDATLALPTAEIAVMGPEAAISAV